MQSDQERIDGSETIWTIEREMRSASRKRKTGLKSTSRSSGSKVHGAPVFKRILVAVDGSRDAEKAVKLATRLAEMNGAELLVISVGSRPPYFGVSAGAAWLDQYNRHANKDAEKVVDEAASFAQSAGVKVRSRVLKNALSAVKSITDYADQTQADLIVVGTRGLGGFKRLLIGSVSSGVVSQARSSVLVTR
jgi:nucleotide-binding universal stress UspA family protein